MPIIEVDQDGPDQLDRLFDIGCAKTYVMNAVQYYIDHNYKNVRKKCCPQPQKDSKNVLSVPCCKSQFHEKCLLSCQNYNVNSCPNPQCQVAENGRRYSKTWDKDFYNQILQTKPLSRKEIAAGTCMLCEDILKIDISPKNQL